MPRTFNELVTRLSDARHIGKCTDRLYEIFRMLPSNGKGSACARAKKKRGPVWVAGSHMRPNAVA